MLPARFRTVSYRRTVIALRDRFPSDCYRGGTFSAVIIPVRIRGFGAVIGVNGEIAGRLLFHLLRDGFDLRHVHRIGIFRAGGDSRNLAGNSKFRISYRNRPIDGLPCIYISVY